MAGAADRRRLGRVALLALVLAASTARADLFSPGELSKPHANLEGLDNCTKCHVAGGQLAPDTCVACHKELKPRIDSAKGFHGRLAPDERSCQLCHKEHLGRDYELVDWGKGGQKAFKHAATGYGLEGKHGKLECKACHDARRISDPAIKALLADHPGKKTFLGLPTACAACHFDEHRGQLGPAGEKCQTCHDATGFKPAKGFDHAKTDYPLEGKHRQVSCEKCHAKEEGAVAAGTFPAPVHAGFTRFKPVDHQSCLACHQDPHENKFGQSCTSCHTVESWHLIKSNKERAFHDKTRFPLKGQHEGVACAACHGPFPGRPAKFKGLAFGRCADCHLDAHVGQLGASPDCAKCHDEQGFTPARFEPEQHAKTDYPLEGAHLAVSCNLCHPKDARLEDRLAPGVRDAFRRMKRKVTLSTTVFHLANDTKRCESCHADAHKGQFDEKVKRDGCTACHRLTSFADVTFDHGRDSRFPLDGKHTGLECRSCHVTDNKLGGVRYRPLETACASCHDDIHVGQFATSPGAATDCTRCHGTGDWKPAKFVHKPPFTAFLLEGKHAGVACAGCHKAAEVARGVRITKFKPTATSCEACHADQHQGAFKGFEPAVAPRGGGR